MCFFNDASLTISTTRSDRPSILANLVSLTGQITGGPGDGEMLLRSYGFDGTTASFGEPGLAAVVPEPVAITLLDLASATAGGLLAGGKDERPVDGMCSEGFPEQVVASAAGPDSCSGIGLRP